MKLTFYGGAGQVTGANYLLEFKDGSSPSGTRKILIDCGLHQGTSFCEAHNYEPFPYDPKEISEVFLTHAHIDHSGRLPKLVKDGFSKTVYSTSPTRDFAELLLYDSQHILSMEAEKDGKKPIYTDDDILNLMKNWRGLDYHETVSLGPDAKATLFSAGHILGSASIVVEAEGKVVVFSGDLGNSPSPLIGPSECIAKADYCLIESAYGNRNHEARPQRKQLLQDVVSSTLKEGGTLMIPAFAMERTQILLLEIKEMVETGKIPKTPIFIDSPLAIKLTTVYNRYRNYFKEELRLRFEKEDAIFHFPGLRMTLTTEDSKSINDVPGPKIIIAGSGMSQGGRILHHEKRYLPDPKSTLLIFGYQAQGSLGRLLLDGARSVRIHKEDVPVRARIKAIGAYSAHADQDQLISWAKCLKGVAKKFFVVQGEKESSEALAKRIKEELLVDAVVPIEKSSVEL